MWKSVCVGLFLTIVYLMWMLFYLDGRISALGTMPLNELGDFLAGLFGPLAFLWLVLSFFQQRNSLVALWKQNKALEQSVSDASEMLDVAKKTFQSQILEREMQAEPFIEVEDARTEADVAAGVVKLRLTNHSTICGSVRCSLEYPERGMRPQVGYFDYLIPSKSIVIDTEKHAFPRQGIPLVVEYKKITGVEGLQKFWIKFELKGVGPSIMTIVKCQPPAKE